MRHMSSESELGKSVTISLRAAQLEAGVSWDILENPSYLPHMSALWISALCAFLEPHDIKLKLCRKTKWESYSVTCEHDSFIMDYIIKSKRFTDREIGDINRARIYYRALTISDIATADGTKINEMYFDTPRPPRQSHSSWRWLTQPILTTYQQNLWKHAIQATFTNKHQRLKTQLGKWTKLTH
jgi:hypothetical protein